MVAANCDLTLTVGFLLGWMVATAAVLTIAAFLSDVGLMKAPGTRSIVAIIKIILGTTLLVLAVMEWRKRPRPGTPAELPRWLGAVQEMKTPAASGMGLVIYLANPKNLALGISSGVVLGNAALSVSRAAVAGVVYVLIASGSVFIPIVAYAFNKERMRPWLNELRVWLTEHNAAVMAVVLGLMGSVMLGKALAGL